MTQILLIREYLQKFYQKHDMIIRLIGQFLISFITFSSINRIIGYNTALNHHYVELLLSAIGMMLPAGVLLFCGAAFTVIHIYYVSGILAMVVAVVFFIIYFAYIKFVPMHAYIILAIPVLFPIHLVYGVPVLLGLLMTPIAVIPLAIGTGVYFFLQAVTSVISTSTDTNINLYHVVLQQFIENKEMYAVICVFAIVVTVVYILRNREWNYAFEISILAGTFLSMILWLSVTYFLAIDVNILALFMGTVVSGILVWIIQFMRLALNYAGVENLQFEDEEYYYYVRAVPKMNVPVQDKSVKKINVRHFTQHK